MSDQSPPPMKKEKFDKKADALRANLQRRKQAQKAKKSPEKSHKDGDSKE